MSPGVSAEVATTRGSVPASRIGVTMMHEHVVILSPACVVGYPFLHDRSVLLAAAIAGLTEAKSAGIDTIVDMTAADLGRAPELVAEAAAVADINVVLCTGVWLDVPRYFWGRGPDEISKVFTHEIEVGIGDTSIRAGVIKVASDDHVSDRETVILRGAARAALRTGVAISTHSTPRTTSGLRQLQILREEGVPPDRVLIGHSGTTDTDYLQRLYDTGCAVGWDNFGNMSAEESAGIIESLRECIRRGYAAQTVLANDAAAYCDWEPVQGTSTFRSVPEMVIPWLRTLGVTESEITAMTVDGPARLLAPATN